VSRPKVLLVEDEPALVRGLSDMLAANGVEVQVATDGQAGLDAALAGGADLMLLDIMLPGVNGFEICRAVRRHGLDVPILMLTAKGQEEDVVLGLNLGADDYITKPFRPAELLARVRALLRRRRAPNPVCHFGECEIDLTARRVRRQGSELPRDLILDAVWGTSVFVTPRSIDRCVTTLRAKVEPNPREPIYIQTVRDVGYRFEPGGDASGGAP
jgi:DNA-binding response OmpR family regulator